MSRNGNGGDRVVVINPNSSQAVTDGIDAAMGPLRFADGPKIDCVTLSEGPPGIESQRDADSVVGPICDLIRREDNRADAFVIACFGDPGLHSARETTHKPVVGIGEASYSAALQLGEKFGVIAILENSVRRQQRYVRQLGLGERYAASVAVGLGVTELEGDHVTEHMIAVGRELIEDHGAAVLILGCAGMARQREPVERSLGVPVIDPSQAAVAQAIAAVRLGYAVPPAE
jgi:Asp/Glu/hydantoin racemase